MTCPTISTGRSEIELFRARNRRWRWHCYRAAIFSGILTRRRSAAAFRVLHLTQIERTRYLDLWCDWCRQVYCGYVERRSRVQRPLCTGADQFAFALCGGEWNVIWALVVQYQLHNFGISFLATCKPHRASREWARKPT